MNRAIDKVSENNKMYSLNPKDLMDPYTGKEDDL